MTIALGRMTGALPSPGAAGLFGKLVTEIIVSPDPTATTVVNFQKAGNTIRAFNVPAATGALDVPYKHCILGEDEDPTEFSIAGGNAFVTYLVR